MAPEGTREETGGFGWLCCLNEGGMNTENKKGGFFFPVNKRQGSTYD